MDSSAPAVAAPRKQAMAVRKLIGVGIILMLVFVSSVALGDWCGNLGKFPIRLSASQSGGYGEIRMYDEDSGASPDYLLLMDLDVTQDFVIGICDPDAPSDYGTPPDGPSFPDNEKYGLNTILFT